jgi:hypothetical protein
VLKALVSNGTNAFPTFQSIGVAGGGTGTGSLPLPIAPGLTGLSLVAQAAILENGDLNTLRTTNGVQIILP